MCSSDLSIPCLLLAVLLVDYRSQSPLVYTQLQIPDLNIKMLGSSKLSLVACLLTLLSSALVHAAPAANPRDALLAARQSAQPTTVQTSEMVETSGGTMMETCQITLTPNSNGSYQEVKSCTYSPISSGAASGTAVASVATAPPTPPAVIANGESSVASSVAFATSASAASGSAATATAASASAADGNAPVNNAAGAATATATGSAPASSASSTGAVTKTANSAAVVTFVVPGRHILILPVGLVIFCTITGIGMLVVGLMHFERMRYRRAFRKRKLAEQGAGMGYGGMAKV